jgi:hypothetical protein
MEVINVVTCPNCDAEDLGGARFCPNCGTGLNGSSGLAPAVHAPLVRLLTEVAELQRDMIQQFERGRRIHSRQFGRALEAQTESMQRTLEHHTRQAERLQAWQKWSALLAAAMVILIVFMMQVVG